MSNKKKIITIVIIFLLVIIVAIFTSKDNATYAVNYTLVDTVIRESKGTTWSSGAEGVYNITYKDEDGQTFGNDYRYIGANPKNFVKFNNDLYQIIGVFDENSHGIEGKQLVKLIRARILGAYSWGVHNNNLINGTQESYSTDWSGSNHTTPTNLNVLLNEYFYNKTTTSDKYGNCVDWTYYNFSSSNNDYRSDSCDKFILYGIDKKVRNYIQKSTWYLFGNNQGHSKNTSFLCERGLYTKCSSGANGLYDGTYQDNIGLMYASDYLYANGYFNNTQNENSASEYYGVNNWLFNSYEWTLSIHSNQDVISASYVYHTGYIVAEQSDDNIQRANAIRPTFYLKEDVYVTGGNGSFDNPYTLDCDTCS